MRPRDYRAEYQRRIAKAAARGFSRSQARGHAKVSESPLRKPRLSLSDERVRIALATLRRERGITVAAKSVGVSPERFRKLAIEKGLIEKTGDRWKLKPTLTRQMPLYSKGRALSITVGNSEAASEVGRFMEGVRHFLETNQKSVLTPFVGKGVRDRTGKNHPFETDPNTLYRLAQSGDASFEQIYRIII